MDEKAKHLRGGFEMKCENCQKEIPENQEPSLQEVLNHCDEIIARKGKTKAEIEK